MTPSPNPALSTPKLPSAPATERKGEQFADSVLETAESMLPVLLFSMTFYTCAGARGLSHAIDMHCIWGSEELLKKGSFLGNIEQKNVFVTAQNM